MIDFTKLTTDYYSIVGDAKEASKLRTSEREDYVRIIAGGINSEFSSIIEQGTDAKIGEVAESILDDLRMELPENALANELAMIQFVCENSIIDAKWGVIVKLHKYENFWTAETALDTWGKTATMAENTYEADVINRNQNAFDNLVERNSAQLEEFLIIAKLALKAVKNKEKKAAK